MRARELIARSVEVQEEIREELRLNREDRLQHREEWMKHREEWAQHREAVRHELRLTREAIENNREVTRVMIAELHEHGEQMRLGFEATFGPIVDLAKEIRGWRAGEAG